MDKWQQQFSIGYFVLCKILLFQERLSDAN